MTLTESALLCDMNPDFVKRHVDYGMNMHNEVALGSIDILE